MSKETTTAPDSAGKGMQDEFNEESQSDIFVKASSIPKDTTLYKHGKRYHCSRCRRGIHNNKVNLKRCIGKGCECICQLYYEGLDGKLRRHGEPDDSVIFTTPAVSVKTDKFIADINKEWARMHQ